MDLHGMSTEESGRLGTDDISSTHPEKHQSKTAAISEACSWRDVNALSALASSEGGLISDSLRKHAWPLLLGYKNHEVLPESVEAARTQWATLPRHRDEDQVQLDVDRSFIYYPSDQSSKVISVRKQELREVITEVLRRQPYLCYFQGYHDICQVFLLVLGPADCAIAMARLSSLRIRDFMLPTLAPALAQLRLIPAILFAANPKLHAHLSQTQPFFALSGTLTMYAHDIKEYGDISRLFDVLLAREAVFSVYMFAQIVLQRATELFETPANEPEILHSILSKLPTPLNLEKLITDTVQLIERHPPNTLSGWRSISTYSVLKTMQQSYEITMQTLEQGELYFKRQVKELQWMDRRQQMLSLMWRIRRPVGTLGLAILVGLVAFYMKKSTGSFWRQWPKIFGL